MLSWSASFAARLAGDPTAYGVTEGQAAAFAELQAVFAEAYGRARSPATATKGATAAKNGARRAMEREARRLARIIGAAPGVTAAQKIDLGLCARPAGPGPALPQPATAPLLSVVGVRGRRVTLRLRDGEAPTRRARPHGVMGAVVLVYVGDQPPADPSAWRYQGLVGATKLDVDFTANLPPGTKVWLTARWSSPRGEVGPSASPVSAYLQQGLMTARSIGPPSRSGSRAA